MSENSVPRGSFQGARNAATALNAAPNIMGPSQPIPLPPNAPAMLASPIALQPAGSPPVSEESIIIIAYRACNLRRRMKDFMPAVLPKLKGVAASTGFPPEAEESEGGFDETRFSAFMDEMRPYAWGEEDCKQWVCHLLPPASLRCGG